MILIYGTYHLFKGHKVSDRAACAHCGQQNRIVESYTAWEFFHLYYFPVIPLGRLRAVLKCPSCSRFYKFAPKGKKITKEIEDRRNAAMSQIGGNINATLGDVVTLTHLGDFEGVKNLLDQLSSRNAGYHALAQGRYYELRKMPREAQESFQEAVRSNPDSAAARFWFGRFLLHQYRESEAIAEFQQAAKLAPGYEYCDMLASLIELRKRQSKWQGLMSIMDEVVRLEPNRMNDKKFAKLYAKVCKKNGRYLEAPNPYA